jgi:hypothetical protein
MTVCLAFRFGRLLLLLVLELAVVHQTTDRRVRRGSNFNQIHIQLTRHAQGFHQADDTQGLVLGPGEANFRGHDFPVQAVLAFFALAAVTKFSSDGSILHNLLQKSSESRTCTRQSMFLKKIRLWTCERCPLGDLLHERIKGHHTEVLLPRARTATAPAAFSLSPTTRM